MARMLGGDAVLIGDKELDRKLAYLGGKGSRKAVRAGIRAGLGPIARAFRSAIQSTSDVGTDLKREAKKSIGSRYGKVKRGIYAGQVQARVGFAVGKKRAKLKKTSEGKSGGVGISAANIHWFVLGTEERRHKASGHPTGKVEAVFISVADEAVAHSGHASMTAARKKIKQVIEREARKKGLRP